MFHPEMYKYLILPNKRRNVMQIMIVKVGNKKYSIILFFIKRKPALVKTQVLGCALCKKGERQGN
jgi:hypothetical protein